MIITIGLIFLILASLFFFFFARSLTRPLIDLVGAAEKIAAGDLAVEVTSQNRQDEIGDLARAFTGMIQSLKDKAQIAQKIAGGDLTVEATSLSDADALGNAFSTMVAKNPPADPGDRGGRQCPGVIREARSWLPCRN